MPEETTSTSTAFHQSDVVWESNKAFFGVLVAVYLCIAAVAVVGNALVLYAAYGNRNTGRLRYLDEAIKSLAVTDMLFG